MHFFYAQTFQISTILNIEYFLLMRITLIINYINTCFSEIFRNINEYFHDLSQQLQ